MSWLAVSLAVGVLVLAVCAAIAWWDRRELEQLPLVNVEAEEELEHLARRKRLHVIAKEPSPVDEAVTPYDWFREGDAR